MKREPYWCKLFLRELALTGNVRLAAERAGADWSTAYQRRKRHGGFAEAWDGALGAHAKAVLDGSSNSLCAADPSTIPSSVNGPPPRSGEELIVRPDGKVTKGNAARWGKRAEDRFLTELTLSANVRKAAEAAGFSTAAVYKRRLKDNRFARAWDAAMETGKARVQAYLIEAATRTFDPDELPVADERELPKVSVSEAINIAKLGSSTGRGGKRSITGNWDEDGGEFITNEEYDEARERVIERLHRLREQTEQQQRETGLCWSCGQPLPETAGQAAGAEPDGAEEPGWD